MAKNSDDCEFWLPPQFLTDDDDLFAEFRSNKNDGKTDRVFSRDYQHDLFLYGVCPFGPYSDLRSPVEGSTETESDEEDFINELNRKFAHSTLLDSGLAHENRKGWTLSGSPQSTICSALGGCESNQGSSRGSPTGHSHVSSPPKVNNGDGAFDLLKAAAGEVARMRLREGEAAFRPNKNGLYGPPRKPSPINVPTGSSSPNLGFLPNKPHISSQHPKAAQFEQLKQQQMLKQQVTSVWGQQVKYQLNHNQAIVQNRGRIASGKPNLSVSAWPTLEQSHRQLQQPGSGMRAVFLGNPTSKRECAGTGVFLPRRFGTPAEIRKKPGCSTVLLPDWVVQALNNLNCEAKDSQVQNRYYASFGPEYEAAVGYSHGTTTVARPRRSVRPQPVISQEVRLPQEWTY